MSLEAAAAALGLPESLVQRSAEARAAETGASVDDILASWAGDAPPPAPAPSTESAPEPVEETPAPTSPEPTPEVVIDVPAAAVPEPVTVAEAGPYKPPVLVGSADNPINVVLGAISLFLIVMLVGLVGPSLSFEEPGARSSELPYTQSAVDGRHVYQTLGCASCHTQIVRPVVADVGLGPVTLNDSNQVIGTRRFGPDLSNVGARITATQLQATVDGSFGDHPSYGLSESDMTDLVAYLAQSATEGGSG